MKKRFLTLLFVPLLLIGCNEQNQASSVDKGSYNTQTIEHARKTGEIGSFSLLGPDNGFSTNKEITFTWQEASNADYYQLEIASHCD